MQDGLIITLNYTPLIRALKEFDSMAKGKAIERFSAMILQDGHFTGEQFGAKGTSKLNILFIELLIVANNHAKLAENGGLTDTRKWDTKCDPFFKYEFAFGGFNHDLIYIWQKLG